MRRAGNFGADAKLDRIYENMRAKYKYTIRLDDLANLADLTDRAADFEEIRKEEAREKQASKKAVSRGCNPAKWNPAIPQDPAPFFGPAYVI